MGQNILPWFPFQRESKKDLMQTLPVSESSHSFVRFGRLEIENIKLAVIGLRLFQIPYEIARCLFIQLP